MKNKILKSSLLIGLIASSMSVIAQEKYIAKFLLNGVNANPTFGMTTTDKQAYQENIENIEMCLKEFSDSGSFYNRNEGEESFFLQVVYRGKSGYQVTTEYKSQTVKHNGVEIGNYVGSTYGTELMYQYKGDIITTETTNSGYPTTEYRYYEINIDSQSENYEWCVNNNYDTKN
jgi:hypothetical protein